VLIRESTADGDRHAQSTTGMERKDSSSMKRRSKEAVIRMTCFRGSSGEVRSMRLACNTVIELTVGGGGQQENKGPGLITNLEVALADMYTGRTIEVCSLKVSLASRPFR
jgi:hypothetical protein